ncbi:MAG: chemotaxis protein CheA [Bacteroidales bacterium]|nr:chemotaxis protein CheA [Bacteroidales bacterium]
MESSINKFKDKFIEEANGLLDQLENDLLELEHKPLEKELTESAFRALHTIKGASNMFGFGYISDFTHHLESLYQLIREQKLTFNSNISDLTFQSVDHIRKMLSDETLSETSNKSKHKKLIEGIERAIEQKPSNEGVMEPTANNVTENSPGTWHILLRTSEALFFRGINLVSIFHELSSLGRFQVSRIDTMSSDNTDTWSIFLHTTAGEQEIREVFLFIDDDCTFVKLAENNNSLDFVNSPAEQTDDSDSLSILDFIESGNASGTKPINNEQANQNGQQPQFRKQTSKRISVESSKIDHLMFLVSELITVNSQLNLSTRSEQFNPVRPYLEKVDSLAKQFRNNALDIRLVPLSDTVLRFQRLIRDLSKQLNKQINFKTQGTNTELDKNTIDQLTEPLMHIIRNCIDHGIESPEARIKKGKTENGTITMSAYCSGNNVYIIISDDGSGINDEKVRQKAIDKGLLLPGEKPAKKVLYDFIFMPGFSTAQSLTEVSGRGVGMDVVKRRINDLRGEVFVDSEPNNGTTFTLKLQQSMSIIDSLLFTVGNSFFTVPIAEIDKCIQVENTDIVKQRHTSTLPFNNKLIPFVDLRNLLVADGAYPESLKSIIIHSNEKEMALLCDKIIGEHQAVLKPLGKSFREQKYITAASQMGDGNMAFMIDTNVLFKLSSV